MRTSKDEGLEEPFDRSAKETPASFPCYSRTSRRFAISRKKSGQLKCIVKSAIKSAVLETRDA